MQSCPSSTKLAITGHIRMRRPPRGSRKCQTTSAARQASSTSFAERDPTVRNCAPVTDLSPTFASVPTATEIARLWDNQSD